MDPRVRASKPRAALLTLRMGLALGCALASTAPLAADWVPVGTAPGGAVSAFLRTNSHGLFAVTAGGVSRSTSLGATWTPADTGLPVGTAGFVLGLLKDPYVDAALYAATTDGVFRTTSSGALWTRASAGLPSVAITALASNDFPLAVYAGTAGHGVYVSRDSGETWSPANEGISDAQIFSLAVDRTGTILAGAADGVARSTDGGMNWTFAFRTGGAIHVTGFAFDEFAPGTVYASRDYVGPVPGLPPPAPGVLKSVDGGATWTLPPHAPRFSTRGILTDPNAPGVVYVIQLSSIEVTRDGGENWESANAGLTEAATALGASNPGVLFAGTVSGRVYRLAKTCDSSPSSLCLGPEGRFRVTASWDAGAQGLQPAPATALSSQAGFFWFFDARAPEVTVKIIDGRAFNRHSWVFLGSMSTLRYTVTVLDTATGVIRTYENAAGTLASVADLTTF